MNKRSGDNKKEWQKPAYESLKFSQTLGGRFPHLTESVVTAHHTGGAS